MLAASRRSVSLKMIGDEIELELLETAHHHHAVITVVFTLAYI
jgi:hypothetical protein